MNVFASLVLGKLKQKHVYLAPFEQLGRANRRTHQAIRPRQPKNQVALGVNGLRRIHLLRINMIRISRQR